MKRFMIGILMMAGLIVNTVLGKDMSLEKVQRQGSFIVGLDDTFAPMGFKDEKGEIVGFDIDLAKEVGKRMGVEVRFKSCDWDGIIFELKSKKIDLIWNGLTVTEERAKQIGFTDPYFSDDQIVITKGDSQITELAELAGKKVGVQLGSSSYFTLEKTPIYSQIGEIRKYGSNVEVLLDVEAGRLDGAIMDNMMGRYYIAGRNFKVLDESLTKDSVAIGVRKEDRALKEEIDRQMAAIKTDGTYDMIYEKWFGGEKNDDR